MSIHTGLKLIMAPIFGFLAGVMVSLLAQIYQLAGPAFALIAIAVFGGVFVILNWSEAIWNRLFYSGVARLSGPSHDIQTRLEAEFAKQALVPNGPARAVFFVSMVIGIIACVIWTPAEIISWINRLRSLGF